MREMSEGTAEEYIESMIDLPVEVVALAILNFRDSGKPFIPSIPELRSASTELLPGKKMPDADAGWGEVIEQIRKVGAYAGTENWSAPKNEDGTAHVMRPTWSHPVVAQVVAGMGDWKELCQSTNPMADRAHFIKLYADAVQRNRREQNMTPAAKALQEAIAGLAVGQGGDDDPTAIESP